MATCLHDEARGEGTWPLTKSLPGNILPLGREIRDH